MDPKKHWVVDENSSPLASSVNCEPPTVTVQNDQAFLASAHLSVDLKRPALAWEK